VLSSELSTGRLEGSLGRNSDLRVFATFEERRDANKSDIIVPHHCVVLVISRNFEYVLKDCNPN
jgi:hypothetical protein